VTAAFGAGLDQVLARARRRPARSCAPRPCGSAGHRRIVADDALLRGAKVAHSFTPTKREPADTASTCGLVVPEDGDSYVV
jgi:hypothetical protein